MQDNVSWPWHKATALRSSSWQNLWLKEYAYPVTVGVLLCMENHCLSHNFYMLKFCFHIKVIKYLCKWNNVYVGGGGVFLVSSPEPKAPVSYCHSAPSVRCWRWRLHVIVRKLFTFSTSSPEPLDGFWWNLVGRASPLTKSSFRLLPKTHAYAFIWILSFWLSFCWLNCLLLVIRWAIKGPWASCFNANCLPICAQRRFGTK